MSFTGFCDEPSCIKPILQGNNNILSKYKYIFTTCIVYRVQSKGLLWKLETWITFQSFNETQCNPKNLIYKSKQFQVFSGISFREQQFTGKNYYFQRVISNSNWLH